MRTGTEVADRIVVPWSKNGAVLIRLRAAGAGSRWTRRRTRYSSSSREAAAQPVLTLARPHGQDPP
ncbi:MAG: hypothetical protein ACJ72G_11185 [Friedmanniella sp.]